MFPELHLELAIFARIVCSAMLAALLGWERERHGPAAGLRTHVLVGMSATLFVSLGSTLVERYADLPHVRLDPLRLIQAVIAGVSFIGAGTIFFSHRERGVKGLTTAGSLLATGGVGTTVGLQLYGLAVLTTLSLFFVLGAVRSWERASRPDGNRRQPMSAETPDSDSPSPLPYDDNPR